ncbi:MAG TPA: hypothetical protein VGI10_27340 [Polyangiaceae bacterium]|jgi:hypothetical protein
MSQDFPSKIAELELTLERVEHVLRGPELELVRELLGTVLEVHKLALEDLRSTLGEPALVAAAAAEPSIAWVLAYHGVSAEVLERALQTAAQREQERRERAQPTREQEAALIPIVRLLRRDAEPTP